MSNGVLLSVTAMYNFDDTLFDKMVFPSQFTQDDKQTTIGNILADCAEFELLYADFDFLKNMIELWSKLNIPVWQRIYTASLMEYNPIENYNRTEIETITDDKTESHTGTDTTTISQNRTETNSGTDTTTISGNRTETNSGTDTTTISENRTETNSGTDTTTTTGNSTETNSGTDTETNKQTAYDSNLQHVHDSSELAHGHTIGINSSGSNATAYGHSIGETSSGSNALSHGEIITNEGEITRENHTSGNIGVTTSQQMLEQEIEISSKLNVINIIVQSFKTRFCILVY